MLEPFEYRGLWWLPEQPEEKVAGVLAFSQEDVTLELIGQLPRLQPSPGPGSSEVELPTGPISRDRILGLSTDGKAFTLEQCHASGVNLSFPGLITERFAPGLILEGAHYEPGEAVLFDELSVRYTQLDAWVATSGFSPANQASGDEAAGIDISFRRPESVEVELPGVAVEIAFAWSLKDAAPHAPEVKIGQRSAFVLRFAEPTAVDRTLAFVYQLRNFVALGVGRPVTPIAIVGIVLPRGNTKPDPLSGLAAGKLKINLFYRLANVPEVKNVHPAQMLFTLADARERIGQLLENWFAKQELLRPVFDLYFGAIYNRQVFLEQRFLSLMQAIETYHRRTSPSTDLVPEHHERRLDEILTATPEEHRPWLAKKLTHSNELVLCKRLEDVLRRCPEVANKLIEKKSSFVHRVGTARNYLTHYNPDLAVVTTEV